ncbi:MAG: metalloregulator ArsR/SmtB family transcription factor [Candidatus Latescibacteria bacterium]|nr:metalloregulator ArsR/SmtB family transcription factor [Candidatus Latescibacterota bacterium]NIM21197.1 metalloregulator ArsR/SmtB family transcription factor [Candidatus Latescibacterota bacterium]NIM65451.1 metalloregulator ArsR/SmtB family transcription factor [Candidatus Latescibacterota bacterium]NIO01829.1 metalloregulator ArsR/SmtB family transcription factor [Candidatus Latescibacterota bacterium]NIO28479.1 metalloregulator ArsR/SmtB family transcription factor [Candidatus Latesciba
MDTPIEDNKLDDAVEDTCEILFVDEEKVQAVRTAMKPESVFAALAEIFKALSDPTRIRILYALSLKELCVCDLANLLGRTSSAVSHQLRVLRHLKLVKFRKEGKIAYYSLDDEHIHHLFKEGLKHVEE